MSAAVARFLDSARIIDSLLSNSKFLVQAKILVNSARGSTVYLAAYAKIDDLLLSLGITENVNIIKSDGSIWYANGYNPDEPILLNNDNTRPEVFLALSYAYGNPICNKKLYPLALQSLVCAGYAFATRESSYRLATTELTAKTYKPTSSPLSTDVFTLRVSQNA